MTAIITTAIARQDLRRGDIIAPAARPDDTHLVTDLAENTGDLVLVNFLAPTPATVHQAMEHLIDHGLTRAIAHRIRAVVAHLEEFHEDKASDEFTQAVTDLNSAFQPSRGYLLSRVVATASLKTVTGLVAAEIGAEDARRAGASATARFLPPFRPTGHWVGFDGDGLLLGQFAYSDLPQVGEAAREEFGVDPVYLRELSAEELF